MFFTVKRSSLIFLMSAAVIITAAILCLAAPASMPAFANVKQGGPVYVLDAGHGGEDGGALSSDGTVRESDVNLAVAQKLEAVLRFLGRETVMTRTDDRSIHSSDAETLRQKKVSDLKNRVALVNGTPGAVLVSIHQNSLPSVPSVRGAQVFYGAAEQGEAFALSVQEALNLGVNVGNEKQEKWIGDTIYLMKHVNCPAILVECGFLSNRAETERLCEPEYQKTLAVSIAAGILNTKEGKTAP